jgi:hypothetical protein
MEDLEDTITFHRQALALYPPGHPDHSHALYNLPNNLYARFESLGRMEDLEDAITYHHQALAIRPPGHFHRSITSPSPFPLALSS